MYSSQQMLLHNAGFVCFSSGPVSATIHTNDLPS